MIKDNFYIKVDNNDKYNPSGSFKSLAKLYSSVTVDGIMPTFLSDTRIWNPVIKSLNPSEDENPIAYDIVEQEDSSKTGCVNNKYEIDFSPVSDFKYGFVDTIVSNKLFKKSGENYINCPVISCYDAAIIKCHTYGTTWTAYSGRHLPNTSNFFPSAIIRGVAGGGGSGGANNVGDDSAGGGGGAGGFFAIYYRIKNEGTNPVQAIEITIGSGGTAGGSGGSGDGGTGGTTQISFEFLNNTLFTIRAFGGEGGQTGNVDYTSGGNGGRVEWTASDSLAQYVQNQDRQPSGGYGGNSGNSAPSNGISVKDLVIFDSPDLYVYLLAAIGGAGGGRGDDTGGSGIAAQAGGGNFTTALSLPLTLAGPKVFGNSRNTAIPYIAGGAVGAEVNDATAGGGGSSALGPGGAGGAEGSSGNPGVAGSGAGGAGVGSNQNRGGSIGGDGVVQILL